MTGFFSGAKTEEEARGWIFSLARCTEICIFRQLLVSFLVSKNDAPCAGVTMMSHAVREAAVTQTHNTSQPWPALRKTFCKMIIKPRNYFHVQWYECKHQLASSWRSFLTLIVSFCPSVFFNFDCRCSAGSLSVSKVATLLGTQTLQLLKKECGGLQTLLKNNHQVFRGETQFSKISFLSTLCLR